MSEENVIVRVFFDARNRRDIAALLACLSRVCGPGRNPVPPAFLPASATGQADGFADPQPRMGKELEEQPLLAWEGEQEPCQFSPRQGANLLR